MLAWMLPPWVAPKKKIVSVASSLSPGTLGRANSATRIEDVVGFETQPDGASNLSVAKGAESSAVRIRNIGSILKVRQVRQVRRVQEPRNPGTASQASALHLRCASDATAASAATLTIDRAMKRA